MTPLPLYLPALRAIERALQSADGPVIAAVDGRCGAGKTTFASYCALYFDGCAVFHMDDFFLPPDKRTSERLAVPGGNVDYERAEKELLLPLSQGRETAYRPFDCSAGGFGAPVAVPPARLCVVEGSYSLHPALAKYAQAKIFFTCSPQVQLARLERREGPEKLNAFLEKWIPLEERYFTGLATESRCDVTVDTTHLPAKEEAI